MLTSRLWSLCLGTTVALTASSAMVSAQTTKSDASQGAGTAPAGDDAATKDADTKGQRPPGPWNNPSMQLRALKAMVGGMPGMPGGGGPGGGRGGFGGGANGMANLLMNSKVLQDEIKLTPDQLAKLKEQNDKANEARREIFTQMRGNGGGRGGNPRGGQPGGQGGQQIDPNAMMQSMEQINQQLMAGISKILDKTQKDRLNQIELRIIGVTAVARPDVAKRLNLSPIQMSQIEEIMMQMQAAQQELMASQRGMFGRGGPGGQNGAPNTNRRQPGAPNGETTKGDTTNGDTTNGDTAKGDTAKGDTAGGNNGRQRPDFNSPEMQERLAQMGEAMTKMNEEAEKLDKKVESAIAKVLTKGQKTKFNNMLGADFDLTALAADTGRGGRGGPGGGNQRGGNPRGGAPAPNPRGDN